MKKMKVMIVFFLVFTLYYWISCALADVINGSDKSIYVKPENISTLVEVKAGNPYKGPQDGVVVEGKVYKNSDGVDLVVEKGGKVNVLQKNPLVRAQEKVRAGELKESPDGTWNPAFNKADEQRALKEAEAKEKVEREKREKEERERAERERKEKEARDQAERERRERHEREIREIRQKPIHERTPKEIDRDQYEIREREERDRTG